MEFVQGVIMKIQSVKSVMPVNCQPIKPNNFGAKRPSIEDMLIEQDSLPFDNDDDICTLSNTSILEQKYDLACRLAAYYKNQCQQLLTNGSCIA